MKYSFPLTPAFFVYPALLLPSWLTYPRWPFSFFIHNSKAGNLTDLKLPPFSILNPNLLPQKRTQAPHFCGYFFSSFVIWLQGQKNQFGGNRMEAEAFMLNVCAVILAASTPMWWCEMPQMWKKGEQIWTLCVPNRKWDIGNRLFATRAETHLMLRRTEAANF